jgi:hypothetical protein
MPYGGENQSTRRISRKSVMDCEIVSENHVQPKWYDLRIWGITTLKQKWHDLKFCFSQRILKLNRN